MTFLIYIVKTLSHHFCRGTLAQLHQTPLPLGWFSPSSQHVPHRPPRSSLGEREMEREMEMEREREREAEREMKMEREREREG